MRGVLVGRSLAIGAVRNRDPALPCRQDYFSATAVRAGAVWSRCFAVLLCAHRTTLLLFERQRSPAAPCAPYGGAPCSDFSFMRGCACLKLSGACARGVEGAMARGWSNPQALPRVAVPSGFFSMCCLGVRSLDSSFICPNVSDEAEAACRR